MTDEFHLRTDELKFEGVSLDKNANLYTYGNNVLRYNDNEIATKNYVNELIRKDIIYKETKQGAIIDILFSKFSNDILYDRPYKFYFKSEDGFYSGYGHIVSNTVFNLNIDTGFQWGIREYKISIIDNNTNNLKIRFYLDNSAVCSFLVYL